MGKGDPQTHSQLMNPFTHDQSWRERIRTEQKRAKGFWAQHSVETVEKLGMDYTQRRPESLIPKHAYADSSASSVVSHGTNGTAMSSKVSGYTMSRGGTGVGSETTQALVERMERLERKIIIEKVKRREVEDKVRHMMRHSEKN
mmetsp:Transcript_37135/g.71256  ORF Transcript_37135/g.71256 Transcript_37135/m.71256 type:complete len:144 (-) Transcript_37135:189-620(-)|eukprot:CAMPEP_0114244546 /NCGR_PEP_ID=MMETSP0058-20121206/11400_1 /TAXON_ID=36894 /ORGANISM="Pyramimonas parkeae, CCMP726" /LENGTH=143 /DNA_ID=CAMNT_0001357499 /DNA_START=144 /DNA_END=575 /DNA_ORIENTATION=+